jgi:enolase
MNGSRIASVTARRVWDSRGRPTVEAEIATEGGARGRAIAPAGASTGSGEAIDLRDGGVAFGGLDVQRALAAIRDEIAPSLRGVDVADQVEIDARLVALDGTADMARLGGNATIAVSMAALHCAAAAGGISLWRHLAAERPPAHLPLPEVQIFGGGAHANRRVDVQDFMVVPVGARDYVEALEWVADVYRSAGEIMNDRNLSAGVADEGGYWPLFDTNEEAIETLLLAIEKSGRRPGEDVAISLDIAASEFGSNGIYRLSRDGLELDTEGMCGMIGEWIARYPICAIEDPLGEDDVSGLARFTRSNGDRVQVIADDAAVTQAGRIAVLAEAGACNALLMKPNQNGTVTGARAAHDAARAAGWDVVISARSGETEDVSIVHMAVGWGIRQLKVGSFSRSERMAKWNEGLRIAEEAPCGAALPDRSSFVWATR